MLNILSHQQLNPSSNIRYLIPFQWWQLFLQDNPSFPKTHNLITHNSLKIEDSIQTIQSKQKQSFLKLVSQKVNFLQIDNYIFNCKLKPATKWKIISSSLYNIIKKSIGISSTLPLFFLGNPQKYQEQQFFIESGLQFKLIKLLFCSFTQNHLFYGYIDKQVPSLEFIKELLSFLDYFYTSDTKITFLESNQFRNYKFQNCLIEDNQQNQLIMIHGLQRYDQKIQQQQNQLKDDLHQYFINSFQSPRIPRIQRNGEQMTMADQDSRTLSEHTMSTGAQTPFTFGIQQQDWDLFRPYQNYGLFGQKLHEEIQHMKQYAREAIYTDIVEVPLFKEEIMINQLQKLADDLQENIQKRKMYQKELAKDNKQYYKQIKESIYLNHLKQKDISAHIKDKQNVLKQKQQASKEGKQIMKVEKNSSIIHYSNGDQNN